MRRKFFCNSAFILPLFVTLYQWLSSVQSLRNAEFFIFDNDFALIYSMGKKRRNKKHWAHWFLPLSSLLLLQWLLLSEWSFSVNLHRSDSVCCSSSHEWEPLCSDGSLSQRRLILLSRTPVRSSCPSLEKPVQWSRLVFRIHREISAYFK